MHKVEVNEKFTVEVDANRQGLVYKDEVLDWDKIVVKDNHFSIIWNNKNYDTEIIKADRKEKTFTIRVNNGLYNLQAKDQFDLLLEKLGMHKMAGAKVLDLKAPMPGLVLDVKVKEGDQVKEGQAVLVLEAMKMENVLKAEGDGLVKKVNVKKSDAVEKNQVMVEFE